jgi:hypothetical protein
VTAEAYELVEHGLITENDFRDFVFANPARFLTSMNPASFNGTAVEREVHDLSNRSRASNREAPILLEHMRFAITAASPRRDVEHFLCLSTDVSDKQHGIVTAKWERFCTRGGPSLPCCGQ